jgi:hypothetical protein
MWKEHRQASGGNHKETQARVQQVLLYPIMCYQGWEQAHAARLHRTSCGRQPTRRSYSIQMVRAACEAAVDYNQYRLCLPETSLGEAGRSMSTHRMGDAPAGQFKWMAGRQESGQRQPRPHRFSEGIPQGQRSICGVDGEPGSCRLQGQGPTDLLSGCGCASKIV